MERTASQRDAELKAKYNPEGSQLRQIQLRELAILVEFDRVCREHGIDYWLDSGTLIGAVRHGGFIPWDDDIDVCIRRKDYKKLHQAMAESLGPDYEYSPAGKVTNYNYPGLTKKIKRPTSRLYDKNVSLVRTFKDLPIVVNENLWIDVYYMEYGSLLAKKIIESTYGKCQRRVWNFINDGKLKHTIAVLAYPFTVLLKVVISSWCKIFHRGTFVGNYGNATISTRKRDDIFPLREIEFEGRLFKAPNNIDAYLRRLYGNYMEIPSEDKIESHHIIELKIIK